MQIWRARNRPTESTVDPITAQSLTTSERVIVGARNFEIVVRGRLSPTLTAAIDGFEVSNCDQGLTHLIGWVPDQARLHSTLELFRDLNIELISLNPAEPYEPVAREAQGGLTRGDSHG